MASGDIGPAGMPSGAGRMRRQRGIGYLMVLFAMAAIGLGLAATGEVWRMSAQRDREAQLLFVGNQFRLALASYRDSTPPGYPIAPVTLAELIEDRRFPTTKRHLRRLWVDPMTGGTEWGLVMAGGRIVGIHSRDEREPIRTAFPSRDAALVGAASYAQWVFTPSEARTALKPSATSQSARSPP